jgi:hypothetical protein
LNFGLSRRRSICLPAQKSWKLRSSERALPCLHSQTSHSRLAQTWFCAGKPKRKPPKVASFKWPPGDRRYAREQADSDRYLEKHHRRSGSNCRRFPVNKQICGLGDERWGSEGGEFMPGRFIYHKPLLTRRSFSEGGYDGWENGGILFRVYQNLDFAKDDAGLAVVSS